MYYKVISFWGMFTGGLVGGALLTRYSIRKCLMAFGVFQGVTPLAFSILVFTGPNVLALVFVVALETFSLGMGALALTTFMLRLCNRRFSATQYALLTSFTGIPGIAAGASAGYIVDVARLGALLPPVRGPLDSRACCSSTSARRSGRKDFRRRRPIAHFNRVLRWPIGSFNRQSVLSVANRFFQSPIEFLDGQSDPAFVNRNWLAPIDLLFRRLTHPAAD